MAIRSARGPWVAACSVLVFGSLVAALLAITGKGSTPSSEVVPLTTDFFSGSYGRPVVEVTVGHSRPIKVLLDTGSDGLRVTASSVADAAGISRSEHRLSATFADGSTFSGTIGEAVVGIGNQATTRTVPFELVSKIKCGPLPDCLSGAGGSEIDGILGIALTGPTPGQPLPNPFLSLPPPYSDAWELSVGTPLTASTSGQLILGATLADWRTQFQLRPVRRPGVSHLWHDGVLTCWSIGARRYAFPTLFDSGSVATTVYSDSLTRLITPHSQLPIMKSNVPVSISGCVRGSPVMAFETDSDLNPVLIRTQPQSPVASLGVQVFYDNTISYNVTKGLISLAPSPAAVP